MKKRKRIKTIKQKIQEEKKQKLEEERQIKKNYWGEFSIYDDVEEPEDHDEWIQYDSQLNEFRKTLDDEHLCVHVDIPAPSFATYCIIYNLSVDVKDTPDQEKKKCPHWTVWGPTLEKYGITEEDV